MRRPRVGQIAFLNCHPLMLGLIATEAHHGLELVKGTPAQLARGLAAGALDVAALSSIEYLRHADELLLLPGLSIAAPGAVQSVQLVGTVEPTRLRGPVALTDASRTSQALLAILLKDLWGVEATCHSGAIDLPTVFDRAQAALLIGDEALRIALAPPPGLRLCDLGAAWHELTDEPMTFAVWAVRREFAEQRPDLLAEVAAALSASLRWGLDNLDEVVADAVAREPFGAAELASYYDGFEFDFGPAAQRGLVEFAERSRRHGLLTTVPTLRFATT